MASRIIEVANDVSAMQRFVTDPAIAKTLQTLVAHYVDAVHGDDQDESDPRTLDMTRDQRVLLTRGIFGVLEEVMGESADAVHSDEDDTDYDEVASAFVELAKKKGGNPRMSQFYKAFMGKMGKLTEPWHENRNDFLDAWMTLGNDTAAKSPAKPSDHPKKLVIVDDVKDGADASSETASADAPLPLALKVSTSISAMGFQHVLGYQSAKPVAERDSLWIKNGSEDGFPDYQVNLIRRHDLSYLVQVAKSTKYSATGNASYSRVYDDDTSPERLLKAISIAYDKMTERE